MGMQGAPTGPKAMARAVVAAGAIVATVVIWGCEKKSDAEADAKPAAPAATETKPADTGATPEATTAAAETKPAEAAPAEKPAEAAPAAEKPAEAAPVANKSPENPPPFDPEHPYKQYPDGGFNFSVYRGYNMYHSICYICHGFEARGSSFGPALKDSLQVLTYEDFVTVVMNGRENITSVSNNVMPSFGENKTVVKYIDSLYAYLKARADGALEPGVPKWEGPKE